MMNGEDLRIPAVALKARIADWERAAAEHERRGHKTTASVTRSLANDLRQMLIHFQLQQGGK